jgi:ribosome-associated protein
MTATNNLSVEQLSKIVIEALENVKANDITILDVTNMSDVADRMIIASGTSNTHLKALANSVVIDCKEAGNAPLSTEGEASSEWVLVDLGDILVHIMLPKTREFYDLERLWTTRPNDSEKSKSE